MERFAFLLAFVLPGATALAASAESFDWPQWQGPDRNAVSKESGLMKEWPKEGPKLAWKTKKLGGGYSEPAIAAGKIYGMSERGDDEVVWALSEKDGKELWSKTIGPTYHGASPKGRHVRRPSMAN
jgi:outer membrane protein assembly factor BamB